MAPKYTGPCIVLERIKPTTYKVKVKATGKELNHHIDNIVSRDMIATPEPVYLEDNTPNIPPDVESRHSMVTRSKGKITGP